MSVVVRRKRKGLLKRLAAGEIAVGATPDLVVFGHEHAPSVLWVDDTLFLIRVRRTQRKKKKKKKKKMTDRRHCGQEADWSGCALCVSAAALGGGNRGGGESGRRARTCPRSPGCFVFMEK